MKALCMTVVFMALLAVLLFVDIGGWAKFGVAVLCYGHIGAVAKGGR